MRADDRWEGGAERWVRLVRNGGDPTFAWNSAAFLELVPPPGMLTVDVGAGEGRLSRARAAAGQRVVGIDAAPTLVRYARRPSRTGTIDSPSRRPCRSPTARPTSSSCSTRCRTSRMRRARSKSRRRVFRIEALRELPTRTKAPGWIPMFLHVRARSGA